MSEDVLHFLTMDRKEVELLLQSVIDKEKTLDEAFSSFKTPEDFGLACDIAKAKFIPAYSNGDMDLGDAWAGMLRDTKLHAINHLESKDRMKFISDSIY